MAEVTFEQILSYLPYWLSAREKAVLFEQLSKFPEGVQFYDPRASEIHDLLQGDGWRGLVVTDFHSRDQRAVSGVILSNSCDISLANDPEGNPRILFAPIIKLSRYSEMLRAAGVADERIASKLTEIRRQEITNLFFFPAQQGLLEESVLVMDDVHQHPVRDFLARDRAKLFTLSQTAFYYFLIKISIFLTRVRENVPRYLPEANT